MSFFILFYLSVQIPRVSVQKYSDPVMNIVGDP